MESTKKLLKSDFLPIVGGMIVGFLITTFLFQFCQVSGLSMYPTLHDGDFLCMDKITDDYERYDVIVVKTTGKTLIKRLIGLPGEEVLIKDGKIFINGVVIEDVVDCETSPGIAEQGLILGDNEFFVLGDNRTNSHDSRSEDVGAINGDNIVGKVVLSVIPWKAKF